MILDISKTEKAHGRIEKRTAYVTQEIDWLTQKSELKKLICIGTVNTEFETNKGVTYEWHYYISSRKMTAEDLLHHAGME